jgi:hypothetical protein
MYKEQGFVQETPKKTYELNLLSTWSSHVMSLSTCCHKRMIALRDLWGRHLDPEYYGNQILPISEIFVWKQGESESSIHAPWHCRSE